MYHVLMSLITINLCIYNSLPHSPSFAECSTHYFTLDKYYFTLVKVFAECYTLGKEYSTNILSTKCSLPSNFLDTWQRLCLGIENNLQIKTLGKLRIIKKPKKNSKTFFKNYEPLLGVKTGRVYPSGTGYE
jgi:hypothetical protein